MPVIVESNKANAELFLSVSGSGTTVVANLDDLRRALAETPDEDAIVLGPGRRPRGRRGARRQRCG